MKKILRISFPFILLLMVSLCGVSQGFIIDEHCANVSEKHYEYCYQWEAYLAKHHEVPDPIRYIKLGRYSLRYSKDLSIAYYNRAMELARINKMDSAYYVALSGIAIPYINEGVLDLAAEKLDSAIWYWKKENIKASLAASYRAYGYLERVRNNFHEALEYFHQCKSIQHQIMDTSEMGDVYNRICITYNAINDTAAVVRYAEEFLNYLKESKKEGAFKTNMTARLALKHLDLGNIEKAKPWLAEVINDYSQSESPYNRFYYFYYKHRMYKLNEDYINASLAVDSSMYYAYLYGSERMIGDAHSVRYYFLKERGRAMEGVEDLNKALELSLKFGRYDDQIEFYKELSELETLKGNFKKALSYRIVSDSLSDKIYSDDMVNKVKALEKKILEDQKEQEIASLNLQNMLKEENLKKERIMRWVMAGLLIFLAGIIYLIYKLFKNKSKAAKELTVKNEAIEASLRTNKMLIQEIHHRVKNNLQVISSLLGLQSRFVTDEMASEAIRTGKLRVQSMSLLHQNLYKNEIDKTVQIKKYFEELCANLEETFEDYRNSVITEVDVDDIELDIDTVVSMGLIVNELITNAYKHAFNESGGGRINLRISEHEDEIILKVSDNGKGIPFTKIPDLPDSLGLRLIQSFTEKLGGTVQIENGIGTAFIIHFRKEVEKQAIRV